jgi:hypothetical protein
MKSVFGRGRNARLDVRRSTLRDRWTKIPTSSEGPKEARRRQLLLADDLARHRFGLRIVGVIVERCGRPSLLEGLASHVEGG